MAPSAGVNRRAHAGMSPDEAECWREEAVVRIRELRAAGKTWAEVSAELGVSRSALRRWAGPAGESLKPAGSRPDPIDLEARAVELHAEGLSSWAIGRQLGLTRGNVERMIARRKLREQEESGGLRIWHLSPDELDAFCPRRPPDDRHGSELGAGHTEAKARIHVSPASRWLPDRGG